jgi:hemerythrin-like domain-containing protein
MTRDVEQLMNDLRGDHRNMALLLDLLDAQIDRLSASEEPDYDLVRDIMLYMTEYPGVVHHPMEDIVYCVRKSVPIWNVSRQTINILRNPD